MQSNRREYTMSKQISPLRQRMIDDMTIRNMSPNTQKIYISRRRELRRLFQALAGQARPGGCSRISPASVLARLKLQAINPIMGALRFFYRTDARAKDKCPNRFR